MGQKVNPIGLRTALTKNWESRWFSDKKSAGRTQFGDWLHEDLAIRSFIKEKFAAAAIARIQIERFANRVRVTIVSARPGVLIGKKGAELESLRAAVAKLANVHTRAQADVLAPVQRLNIVLCVFGFHELAIYYTNLKHSASMKRDCDSIIFLVMMGCMAA